MSCVPATRCCDGKGNRAEIILRGPQGPPGPPGPPGAAHTHVQHTPTDVWIVQHDLGYYPLVSVVTTGGLVMDAEIEHLSPNHAAIRLNVPMSGTARAV